MKVDLRKLRNIIEEQRVIVMLIIISVVVQILNSYFLSFENIVSILLYISIEGIIIIGMSFLIIIEEIDLSVGAIASASCCIAIYLQKYGVLAGILSGILIGILIGYLNGLIVVKFKISSMPVTLGMMVLLNGIVYVVTKSQSVPGTNETSKLLASAKIFGVPTVVYVSVILLVIFDFLLRRTYFGRCLYACGGNMSASEYAGININFVRISAFALTGFLCGIAGVLLASKINIASGTVGQNTALYVITAALLGGVSLSGGEGTIAKAFQGLLMMGVLNNSMQLLLFPDPIRDVIIGAILIVTLTLDAINTRKMKYI